jgi:ABC-type Fe3+-siderophore transport system permease subunit
VLLADGLAQQHVSTALQTELPVGVFTAMVGAPALVLLARRLPAGGTSTGARLGRTARAVPFPVVAVLAATALLVALAAGLMLGDLDLSAVEVIKAVVGATSDDLVRDVVVDLRLPRLVVAALAGASLAVCGTLLQAISRNPLADPSVIGVTGGAAVGGLTLLLVDDVPATYIPLGAFAGGLAAVAVVLLATWRPRHGSRSRGHRPSGQELTQSALSPERLLLVGVAVAAFATAVADLIVVLSPLDVSRAVSWLSGSTYARDWDEARLLVLWPAVLLPVAFAVGRHLDVLGLGDDLARSLGVRVDRARLVAVLVAVLLAAAAVAAVGTIGFVGLVAPHAARTLVGARTHRVLLVAPLLGAALVTAADTVGRVALAPREVPSGLVVALIGAPYFVYLMWRAGETSP